MTRGTYTRVLLATGLAFCTPALGVNPAAATHVVGLSGPASPVAPTDEPGPSNTEVEPAQPTDPPADATPADATPAQETPAQETPAQETPAQETPAQETPAQEAPAEEAPAAKTPTEPAPAEQAPAQPAPAEQAPAEEEAGGTEGSQGLSSTLLDKATTLVQVAGESTQPPAQ